MVSYKGCVWSMSNSSLTLDLEVNMSKIKSALKELTSNEILYKKRLVEVA